MPGWRILLAAEFPRGSATLARLLPIAATLAERGIDIAFAVPAPQQASVLRAGFPVQPAPRWTVPPTAGFAAVSYADILLHGGYAAPDALDSLLQGWDTTFAQFRPDLLLADFAPTAMLAARLAGIPVATVGDGFSLPPPQAPFPLLQPWLPHPGDTAESVEARVLATVNLCLAERGQPQWSALHTLFDTAATFLCTVAELDHYPDRPQADWFGPIFPPSTGPEPIWPDGDGPRAYIDLEPRHPALARLADALDSLGMPTLIQSVAMTPPQAAALERPAVKPTTANRAALLTGASFTVCQSLEVAEPALLAGRKVLMLPVFVEQTMTLHRIVQQGLGHGIAPDADEPALAAALSRLAADTSAGLRALNLGRHYDGYQPRIAIDAIADAIDDLFD